MTSSDVPEGTISDVLAWVDGDPARAEAALDAEYDGQVRSTLINQLEAIAAKEAPVSTEPATNDEVDEAQAEQDELAPEQPTEVSIDANDKGLNVMPLVVRDGDVEAEPALMPAPKEVEAEQEESIPIEGEPVESLEAVSSTAGLVIGINGTAYGFTADMTASLKQIVDKAVVGLSF